MAGLVPILALIAVAAPLFGQLAVPVLVLMVSTLGLLWGGSAVVINASGLARRFGATDFAVAATVVAIGTSLPELFVSLVAVLDGHPDIAVGNVFGSNIANIGLVLGFTASVSKSGVEMKSSQTKWMLLFYLALLAAMAAFLAVPGLPRHLSWPHGIVMLVLLAAVVIWLYSARREGGEDEEVEDRDWLMRLISRLARRALSMEGVARVERWTDPRRSIPFALGYLVLGLVLLYFGGKGFVAAASDIAGIFGISELVIALVIVAVGTSLPEVAVSTVASKKGKGDVSLGNIVGSNVFNVLLVLGVSSLFGVIPVNLFNHDMLTTYIAMVAFGAVLLPVAFVIRKIPQPFGFALLAAYGAMVVLWFR